MDLRKNYDVLFLVVFFYSVQQFNVLIHIVHVLLGKTLQIVNPLPFYNVSSSLCYAWDLIKLQGAKSKVNLINLNRNIISLSGIFRYPNELQSHRDIVIAIILTTEKKILFN